MASNQFGCGKCDSRWGGYRTAHCAQCHKTFSGIDAFDKHLDIDYRRPSGTEVACKEPRVCRLVVNSLGYWGSDQPRPGTVWTK